VGKGNGVMGLTIAALDMTGSRFTLEIC